MVNYILWSIMITNWRLKYKKRTDKLDNEMRATAVDSLLNFETVKYYSQENYEAEQYHTAIKTFIVCTKQFVSFSRRKNFDFSL